MKKIYMIIMLVLSLLIFSSQSFSQILEAKSLPQERNYEPIVLLGSELPQFENVPVGQLYLYAYHSAKGWLPIPFQIDEKDPDYFDPGDGKFDNNDEFVFLTKDLGDRVSSEYWIDNIESRANNRYEIEFVDGTDQNKKGWCYLYQSSTLTEADKSDTTYVSYNAGEDKVTSSYYVLDYANKWFPKDVRITAQGNGSGVDFYDQSKLRVVIIPIVYPLVFIEDSLITQEIKYNENQVVRLKRQLLLNLVIEGQVFADSIKFTMTYYPYSMKFSGQLELLEAWKVKTVRMSYDLNENAIGMKFFSGDGNGVKNSNHTIDGANKLDNVDTTLVKNVANWTMATGTPGTMLTINNVNYESDPIITEPYFQYLYYWDDATGGTLDGHPDFDTGDLKSYGDHGMMFTSYSLAGVFTYNSTTYLLGANQSSQFAQTIFNNFLLNMSHTARSQTYTVDISDRQNDNLPDTYHLNPNYPNPFNPTTTISFYSPQNDNVSLEIFDVKGNHIITLANENLKAGIHKYMWNGKDKFGSTVSSGVYVNILKTNNFKASQKMILIK